MFWDRWIPDKYFVKSEICGVEVFFNEDGIVYHYTTLRNKGKKLEIVETGSLKDSPELPKSILKNKIPLIVVINGRGVILKKISISENLEPDTRELITQNLPAINQDEFYIQVFTQDNHTGFISLCRKEQIDSVLKNLSEKKYDIANVIVGPAAVIGLKPLWGDFNSIATSSHRVELTNGQAENFSPQVSANEKIKIDALAFSAEYTLGFSAGLSYLMRRRIAETTNKELESLPQTHLEKNKFRFLMIVVVAIAFTIAATNVVFYTNYFDRNNKLETELSVYQGKYEQINQLLSDYQKKKNLIENAGVLNRNKLSEYADRIAKTIPEEVALTEMYFNPKDESEESLDSLVKFRNKELIIRGNCNKSLIINEWVNVLKMQKFIKDVSLEKFAYNNEGILPNYEIKLITE